MEIWGFLFVYRPEYYKFSTGKPQANLELSAVYLWFSLVIFGLLGFTIIDKLESIEGQNNVLLQSIFKLLSSEDITSITEWNDENYSRIVAAIGGEDNLQALKKEKFFKEKREDQIALIDDAANILSDTVALAPFAAVLRGISLLAKLQISN